MTQGDIAMKAGYHHSQETRAKMRRAQKTDHQNILIGMAGQLRVASELLLRGFRPALGFVDTGVDLTLEQGQRIQVKAAHKAKDRGRYFFNLRHWKHKGLVRLPGVDFLICWGIDTDQFWIVPVEEARKVSILAFCPGAKRGRRKPIIEADQFLNAWSLLRKEDGE